MKDHAIYVLLFATVTACALPAAAQGPNGPEDGATEFPHFSRSSAGEERRLRNLRLKEAVQAGDLSPEDARRLQRRHQPAGPPPGGPGAPDRYGPDGLSHPPLPPPGQRNFWRDKRQKAQEQYQND
ncbi:hypothetical protein DLM_3868 [Aquitalea magnusonii]|jgi:hypothetical protein|uniref:Uncharacterized protein n=1 Tax=Aquitalea magnusonii TaxID=332411 RepID=A0A3G9GSM6_9NEIS|nr:hypothetical protein [Aquitalea magnusonii]BBF87447.1 hypothetical protein DLM_3868 [Aquitalea magnusonii]